MVVTAVTRLYRVYGPGVCMVRASCTTITLCTRTVYTCTNRDASLSRAHIYCTRSKVRHIVFVHEKYVIIYIYIYKYIGVIATHARDNIILIIITYVYNERVAYTYIHIVLVYKPIIFVCP